MVGLADKPRQGLSTVTTGLSSELSSFDMRCTPSVEEEDYYVMYSTYLINLTSLSTIAFILPMYLYCTVHVSLL
jgi:hypothetical protein